MDEVPVIILKERGKKPKLRKATRWPGVVIPTYGPATKEASGKGLFQAQKFETWATLQEVPSKMERAMEQTDK